MAGFRKRENGKWQALITFYDDKGKRHLKTKSGFSTKTEAKRYAREIEDQISNGTLIKKEVAFADYFQEWFKTYKEKSITSVTAGTYSAIYQHIKKYFGKKKLNKITRRDYQLFINEYGGKHAKITVTKANAIIKAVVQSAVYDGLIQKDFTQRISLNWNPDKTRKSLFKSVMKSGTL